MGDYNSLDLWASHPRNIVHPVDSESYDIDTLLSEGEGADLAFETPLRGIYIGAVGASPVLYLRLCGDAADTFLPWTVQAGQYLRLLISGIGGTDRGTADVSGVIGLR